MDPLFIAFNGIKTETSRYKVSGTIGWSGVTNKSAGTMFKRSSPSYTERMVRSWESDDSMDQEPELLSILL